MDITADSPLPSRPGETTVAGRRIDWTPRDVGIGVLLVIALFIVVPIPIAAPFAIAYGEESKPYYAAALVLGGLSSLGLIGVAAWLSFRKYGGGLDRLGLVAITGWAPVLWAGGALAVAFAAGAAYAGFVEVFDIDALRSACDDQLPRRVLDDPALLAVAGVIVVGFAPVCEEIFFRGFAFPGLARSWGVAAGVVASGLLFSLAHVSPNIHKTLVPILAIGVVFAYTYHRSGNILSTMLAHFVFNAISFTSLATTCD